MDLTGLKEVMTANGYDLDVLTAKHAVAVFGSRAAGCHRPDSDWDVVVLTTPVLTDRKPGIDYLQEDPPNDPNWYSRDLAFHLSGYAIWLSGRPNWDPDLLDWNRAIGRKAKKIQQTAPTLGKGLLSPFYRDRWMLKLRQELGRMLQLMNRQPISPTKMLPSVTVEDFKSLVRDDNFLRLVAASDSP